MKIAENAAMCGVVNHTDKNYSVGAIEKKIVSYYKLYEREKAVSFTKSFIVPDDTKEKRYIIKTDAIKLGKPTLRRFDMEDHEIGRVETDKDWFTKKYRYPVYLDGGWLGIIDYQPSVKIKLNLDFNGWHVEGSFMQYEFTVFDKQRDVIMKIHSAFSSMDTYML